MIQAKVHQLSVKPETPGENGLPKASVDRVRVSAMGFDGDFNRNRHEKHADDPDRAILVMPLETIEELNAEGWPVKAGDLAENVTTTGILHEQMTAGSVLRAGDVELVFTKPNNPCKNLADLPYVGKERLPDFIKTLLGRRGWFARVERASTLQAGDSIQVDEA